VSLLELLRFRTMLLWLQHVTEERLGIEDTAVGYRRL
jgi:hypothetical protein